MEKRSSYILIVFMRSRLFSLMIFCSSAAFAQTAMTQYLASPIADAEYQTLALSQAFMNEHSFSSPWLRELDFRIRVGGGESSIDEYRMRLGFINPLEIRANKTYSKMLSGYIEDEKKASINDALFHRYEILLEHYFLSTKLDLINGRIQRLEQIVELSLDMESDIKDLISLESTKTKLLLEASNTRQKLEWANNQILSVNNSSIDWKLSPIIEPDLLISIVNELTDGENYYKLQREQDLAMKQQMLKIDKAEAFSNIGFIQSEYDVSRGNTFEEHLGFQVGVNIPIFNTDKPKLERKQLDLIDDVVKLEMADSIGQLQIDQMLAEISKGQMELGILATQRKQLFKYQSLIENLDTNIETLLELTDYEFLLTERELVVMISIRATAVKLLHHQGRLYGENSSVNYLDVSQAQFELR